MKIITLYDFLQQFKQSDIMVLAGQNGLDRKISNITVLDAPDAYEWLRGNELILTSGYIFEDDSELLEKFISNLVAAGASGVGLKMGRFVHELPSSVKEIAEKHHFPILKIPYDYVWSNLIASFYDLKRQLNHTSPTEFIENRHKISNGRSRLYHHFMSKIIAENISSYEMKEFEKRRGLKGTIYCGFFIIHAPNYLEIYDQFQKITKYGTLNKNTHIYSQMIDHSDSKEAIVFIEYEQCEKDINVLYSLRCLLGKLDESLFAQNGFIAIGSLSHSLQNSKKSYHEAVQTKNMRAVLWNSESICFYDMISPYLLFQSELYSELDLTDITQLEENRHQLAFDGIKTIETFLELGSYKKAAKNLFIHENTLRYRIQKINDLLCLDLNNPTVKHSLFLKIKIWRIKNL